MEPGFQNVLWEIGKLLLFLESTMGSLLVSAVFIGQKQSLHCHLEGCRCKASWSLFIMGVISSFSPLRSRSWWGRRSHEGALRGEGLLGHGSEAELHRPPSESSWQGSEGDSGLCTSSSHTRADSHLFRQRLLGYKAVHIWLPSSPTRQKEPETKGTSIHCHNSSLV